MSPAIASTHAVRRRRRHDYFGADTDILYALEPDGRTKWTILPAEDTEKPELHDVDTAPILRGGVGFVGAGLYLYAFDRRGTVRWRTATGNKVFSSPALLPDGTIVAGSQDDKLWALRPAGAVRWTYQMAADVDGSPAIDELLENIYVGADDGRVHAVSFDGKRRWTVDAGGFVRGGIAVDARGRVYVTTFGPTARLLAFDPEGGWVRWTVDAGSGPTAEFGIRSSPVVDPDGVVLFGAPGGFVRAVSPDGEELWTFRAPDDVDAGPILADDGTSTSVATTAFCARSGIRLAADARPLGTHEAELAGRDRAVERDAREFDRVGVARVVHYHRAHHLIVRPVHHEEQP